ncbi:interferon-induced 35 kDa protein isoform X2 [Phyllobates terribilis]|uniref:interferon-induced 35 kDa protein isoform X2 n=2 Tax=Phyllobates terribilis TaxID=111132 RepID=UPI003CCB64FE
MKVKASELQRTGGKSRGGRGEFSDYRYRSHTKDTKMASETVKNEDEFVHVVDDKLSEEESLRQDIEKYKGRHSALLEEIAKLEQKTKESENLAQKFQDRVGKEEQKLIENEQALDDKDQKLQEQVKSMRDQNQQMKTDEQTLKEKISYLEKETEKLEAICSSGVERKMVFKGKVSDNLPRCGINVKHQIRYPVKGGTALVVFEEPSVAARIIQKTHHKVKIEDCHINVKAEPIELMVLDTLSMDMSLSPQKILVSNLPASVSEEVLLDKLELFFGKTKYGGGEVESREFLADSRSAILTFANKGVAPQLVEKKKYDVPFGGQKKHEVCVSLSLDGDIKRHDIKRLQCNRTVLITGIPDIKDEETLNDLLQIHFQMGVNGGGEVEAFLYCPKGKSTIAVFEDDEDVPSQKE